MDEASKFDGRHPSEQARRRGWGDDWDNTPGGVILRPIPVGTLVEFYDLAHDQLMLGRVVARHPDDPWANRTTTTYEVETPTGKVTVGRESIAIFDRSPEGIEAFLEGERTAETMSPEEMERWLGNA